MVTQVEKAIIADIPQIHKLINDYAKEGEMLARPLSDLYEDIRDFLVVREGDRVVCLNCDANLEIVMLDPLALYWRSVAPSVRPTCPR